MINLDLGRLGKVRISGPSGLEIVTLTIVLAFAGGVLLILLLR
jgi:hypothetical protein